jgi:AAA15 family ATPase/GTPase
MISSISFSKFKSYRDATLPLAPLSLLIGANASGKSNAIEGIRFLSWLAEGRKLDDLMSAVQAENERIRGTLLNLVYDTLPSARVADLYSELKGTFGFRCQTDIAKGEQFSIEIQVSSEGMRIVAESVTSPDHTVPLYEEIDNGVHPSRAGMLLDNIQDVARGRKIRVLVTTHNPALLDALPTEAIPDVVCCYRDPDGGDSKLIRLEDLKAYPELIAQGPLGQLMTKGVLDRYLKDRTIPEQRRADAMEWLKSLKGGGAA